MPKLGSVINDIPQQQSQETHGDGNPPTNAQSQQPESSTSGNNVILSTAEVSIKASPAMVRCSKIMKMLRDIHTTVLSSLEGIADQVILPQLLIGVKSSRSRAE